MKGIVSYVLGIIVCIALIVGGLSGKLVLKGTNSSMALVVVGSLLLAWDLFKLLMYLRKVKGSSAGQIEDGGATPK